MSAPDDEGQVSEASNLEDADEPIQPDQAVAGAPEGESGEVQEGKAGPNATTGSEEPDHSADPSAASDASDSSEASDSSDSSDQAAARD